MHLLRRTGPSGHWLTSQTSLPGRQKLVGLSELDWDLRESDHAAPEFSAFVWTELVDTRTGSAR